MVRTFFYYICNQNANIFSRNIHCICIHISIVDKKPLFPVDEISQEIPHEIMLQREHIKLSDVIGQGK